MKENKLLIDRRQEALVQGSEQEFLAKHREEVELLRGELHSEGGDSFTISSNEDYVFAGELLKHVKVRKLDIESRRKEVTKPLNDALTAFRKWYKPSIDLWESLEKLLKDKMSSWNEELVCQREVSYRQVEAASEVGDYDGAQQIVAGLAKVADVPGVSVRDHWVVDIANVDVTKAPAEFLMVNLEAANLYIKEFGKGEPAFLPGIPFKKVFQIVGSTKG